MASSGAQQGPSKKHRDLGHALMTWHYPAESCPEWFIKAHSELDGRAFDASQVRDEPVSGEEEYVQFHVSAFEQAIENIEAETALEFSPVEAATVEEVVAHHPLSAR